MTKSEIIAGAQAVGYKGKWYHTIQLHPEYTTESFMEASFPQWDQVRKVRSLLDYRGKTVLDVGTADGMWAFEAEALGASTVVACDIWQEWEGISCESRFQFARKTLNSGVIFRSANVQFLVDMPGYPYDIIQCLGVLYHVQNPLLALHQLAHKLAPGGKMLLETAVWPGDEPPAMRFNSDEGIYCDKTTFWAPNWSCLVGMLSLARLKTLQVEKLLGEWGRPNRVCLIAELSGEPSKDFGLVQ